MQYFYDQSKSTLNLLDLQFVSSTRGIGVGNVIEGRSRKGVQVLTHDGGANWQLAPTEENPLSIFFLNDSFGWMVTEKGLWRTTEAGKDWRKLPHPPAQPLRVYFTDENNGWAACLKK